MEDFWAGTLWTLKIWLYLIVGLIMIPAMFGFSLGISETYMTILVKTLEVSSFLKKCFWNLFASNATQQCLNVSCASSCCAVGHSEDAEGQNGRASS